MDKEKIQLVADKVIKMLQQNRKQREAKIPKVPLHMKHVQNCELLLNREELLKKMKKQSIVAEIGVDEGKFSRLIHKIVQPGKLHLIDMWGTDRFHEGKFQEVQSFFENEIKQQKVMIHKKLSVNAAHDFIDNYFDWIYIDTDHSYETTRNELRLYAPKVKQGGIIAGHDYVKGNWITTYRYGVIEAVHEFCVNNDWELIYLTAEPKENQSFAIRRTLQ
ncbi:MAG: class I SAM-dependent methyltransferase [Balneolales bacterium]